MRWTHRPVESVPPSRFRPRFCPWPECRAHRDVPPSFHGHGTYLRRSDRKRIPRYLCLHCHRTCSRQTFSVTYYLKRRDLPVEVAAALQAGSAHRQIARSRRCTKTTVTRLADRLGRHACLLLSRALVHLQPVREKVVHDHFETFIGRQDHALGIGTPVGAISRFGFGPDPAPHQGPGRRPDRGGTPPPTPRERAPYVRSIARTLDLLAPLVDPASPLTLVVDGRKDYERAWRAHPGKERFRFEIHPNPERGPKGSPRSPEAIARDRAMAPTDQLHQFMRHTCADHKRETIAFGRRLEAIVLRIFLTTVWKNFVKGRSERRPDRTTPAMAIGLTDAPWSWRKLLAQRLFPAREPVPDAWLAIYRRTWNGASPRFSRKHAG